MLLSDSRTLPLGYRAV